MWKKYTVDPFNVFDLTACSCATIGLFWLSIARTMDAIPDLSEAASLASAGLDAATGAPSQKMSPDAQSHSHDLDASLASADVFQSIHISIVRWLLALAVFFGWMRMLRLLSISETMGSGKIGQNLTAMLHLPAQYPLAILSLALLLRFSSAAPPLLLRCSSALSCTCTCYTHATPTVSSRPHPSAGPFTLMFLQMFADIIQWLLLLAIILLATSSALYVLHTLGAPKPYLPSHCSLDGTPFVHFQGSILKVFEGSLIGDPYFDCMGLHNEFGSIDYWIAWLFAVCFQIVVGLLLVWYHGRRSRGLLPLLDASSLPYYLLQALARRAACLLARLLLHMLQLQLLMPRV